MSGFQFAAAKAAQAARDRVGLDVGARPPEFSVTDLNGTRHTLTQHRGDVVVLHFWATWCPYCRGEIPKLTRVHQELAPKGVTVLAVSADEDLNILKRFVAQKRLSYPVIADIEASSSVAMQYQLEGVPTTFVVGRDGRITARIEGSGDIIGAARRAL